MLNADDEEILYIIQTINTYNLDEFIAQAQTPGPKKAILRKHQVDELYKFMPEILKTLATMNPKDAEGPMDYDLRFAIMDCYCRILEHGFDKERLNDPKILMLTENDIMKIPFKEVIEEGFRFHNSVVLPYTPDELTEFAKGFHNESEAKKLALYFVNQMRMIHCTAHIPNAPDNVVNQHRKNVEANSAGLRVQGTPRNHSL